MRNLLWEQVGDFGLFSVVVIEQTDAIHKRSFGLVHVLWIRGNDGKFLLFFLQVGSQRVDLLEICHQPTALLQAIFSFNLAFNQIII